VVLPTVRPRAAADGDRRRRGFSGNWSATSGEEHQWTTGKLVPVLVEVEEVRCGLPTGVPCAAGVEGDGGGGMQLEYWKLDAGSSRTERKC
jgi:hypothetical protein